MASDLTFVEYVCDQMSAAGTITFRKMFGEYAIYCEGKVVALEHLSSRTFAPGYSTVVSPLTAIRLGHTIVWVFFVACIFAIPLFTASSHFRLAALFTAIVAVEVGVLVLNGMRCPLTGIAARYTDDRRPNFDIYLPEWLARNNKQIFGTIYAIAVLFLLVRWLRVI